MTTPSQREVVKAQCSRCENVTNHTVQQEVSTGGSDPDDEISWSDRYQIIQCNGCEEISFRHVHWFSEDRYWGDENDNSDGSTIKLYPMRSESTLSQKSFENITPRLRRIYRETIDCYNNESFTLCAAGLRAIVEGICGERGVTEGPVTIVKNDGTEETKLRKSLEGKINGLQARGFLTNQKAAMLHEHRFLGNDAVHELDNPSRQELAMALDIVEHILNEIYEMPDVANELRAARLKRTNQKPPTV